MVEQLRRLFLLFSIVLIVLTSFSPLANAAENDFDLDSTLRVEGLKHDVKLTKEQLEQQRAIAEQLELINGPATISENLEGETGQVDVIVHYRTPSVGLAKGIANAQGKNFTAADEKKIKNDIAKERLRVQKERKFKKIKVKEKKKYDVVLNAEALTVDAKDLDKLLELKDVAFVEKDTVVTLDPEITKVHTPESAEVAKGEDDVSSNLIPALKHLEIEKVWEIGEKGNGVKVGVLDTGIDYNHPDLKDVYKGGRNYVEGNEYKSPRAADDPYETNPAERPDNVPEERNGSEYWTTHGTHVAGTIAAQGNNEYGVVGVAPNVQLYAYRVLGAYGSGYTNWIVSGIEDAVKDGMDVINLSLGNSSADEAQANSFAVNNAMLLGTVAVSATGNSGPNRSTVGGPASGAIGIGVGNTTLPELKYYANVTLESGDYNKELKDVLFMTYTMNENPEDQLSDTEEVVAVPNVGKVEDFKGLDVKDKVALIQRGDIPFVEKIQNAKEQGAKGVIIYNSESGSGAPGPTGLFLGKSFHYVPTLDVGYTDGKEFKEAIDKNKEGKVTFNSFKDEVSGGDAMNDSSSRGPSKPNFDIKPDVSAPGTNILSTVPVFKAFDENMDYTYAFAEYTGTSMATPHVAGIAALILELNPDYTPFDVKSALSNTAKLLDTSTFDVFDQGAGLVQPYAAATTDSLLKVNHETEMDGTVHEHTRGTMSFGKMQSGESKTKELFIENNSGSSVNYNIEIEMLSDVGINLQASETSVSTADNASVEFTIDAPEDTPDGTEVQGYIHVKSDHGDYSVPFAALIGDDAGGESIKKVELQDLHISPNDDGVQDETVLDLEFGQPQSYALVSYFNLLDPKSGPDNDGYEGTIDFLFLPELKNQLPITGDMYNIVDEKRVPGKIDDGVYTVDVLAIDKQSQLNSEFDGPLFVKRKATEITEAKVVDGNLDITVDDLYINALPKLKELYGLDYDPNLFVKGKVKLSNGEEELTGNGQFTKEGKFNFDQKFDTAYHLTIDFADAAGNSKTYEYTVNPAENDVKEGHHELPNEPAPEPDPEPEPEPGDDEGEFEGEVVSFDPNNYDGLFVNGRSDVVADFSEYNSVAVELDNNALNTLSKLKKNKSLTFDLGGYGVKFNVDNFKELNGYDNVYVVLEKFESDGLSDQLNVKLIVESNGAAEEVSQLNSNFVVLLESPKQKVNVLNVNSGEQFKGNGLFNKKSGQVELKTKEFSAYVVVEQ